MATQIADSTDGYFVLNQNQTSNAYRLQYNFVAVQFVWTGDGYGTITLQESWNRTNWKTVQHNDIDGYQCSGISVAGAASTDTLQFINIKSPFIRVRYTYTSGTGGLDFYIKEKQANFGRRLSGANLWRSFFPDASGSRGGG